MQKKHLTKVQHPLIRIQQIGYRRNIPQHNKSHIYNKLTDNTILNSEKIESFPSKSRNKTGCTLLHFLVNTVQF